MPEHVRNQHTIRLATPADVAINFFTPAGESLWIPEWQPHYLHPATGETRQGMVFTTDHGSELTIWALADFDRTACRARYVRTTPGRRTGFVEVRCRPTGATQCEVDVSYEMTALPDGGPGVLAGYEGRAFSDMIDGWAAAIEQHLPQLAQGPFR